MNLFDFNLTLPITDPTWVFFLVLIIILFAPMILGRLHIPHIIGMILAGVLIGEHGFHVLDRDSSFELFGKVGLYYIMFLAGLEMDMEDFKKNRMKGIGRLAFFPSLIADFFPAAYEHAGIRFPYRSAARQYVCFSHFDCLSYYQPLRIIPSAQCQYYYRWYGHYGNSCPYHPCRYWRNV